MVAVAASLSLQKPCLAKQAGKASSRAPRAAVRVQAVKQEQKVCSHVMADPFQPPASGTSISPNRCPLRSGPQEPATASFDSGSQISRL
jgi:hypothetical protein